MGVEMGFCEGGRPYISITSCLPMRVPIKMALLGTLH